MATYFKKVENAEINLNQPAFNKKITNYGENTLTGNELKFTYCDVSDLNERPYGNLFNSFNLPITDQQINDFRNDNLNNSFKYFNDVTKIIVVEIPQNTYGELIDGKTFKLAFPINSGMTQTVVNCYGNYYYDRTEQYILETYNKRYADSNGFSAYFGINPASNDLKSSNIAYLFSNEIAKPKISYTVEEPTYISSVTATSVNSTYGFYTGSFNFQQGKFYEIRISDIYDQNDIQETTDISKRLELKFSTGTQESIDINLKGETDTDSTIPPKIIKYIRFIPDSTTSTFTITSNKNGVGLYATKYKIKISEITVNEGLWSRWTKTNKFNVTSKKPAFFSGDELLIDQPVGILYLDKGFAVITDSTLVQNFDYSYSGATSSGYDSIAEGQQYTGDTNFTQIYFNDSTIANAIYNSIYTEFIQSVTCIASPNEFYISSNPTFIDVYGEEGVNNTNNDPVYITEIGLYNANKELIAIAKTSEPIPKDKFNIVAFTIDLKI